MSDDLVKRWDDHVESLCSPMSTIEHMAQKMRNRIEALTAERDRLRAALEDIADHDTGATAGLAYTAKIALKGETP